MAEPRFARRFVHGLFAKTTLAAIALCVAFSHLVYQREWLIGDLIAVVGLWPFVAACDAGGKGARARRSAATALAREERWAAEGRPWWASSFRLTLVAFPLLAVAVFGIALHARHQADALSRLPACSATGPKDCIGSRTGVVWARQTDRSTQTITVLFGSKLRQVHLSSDGWGGAWRGHFPVGEPVIVRFHGDTPLLVVEPDGHHRKTADNPSGTAGAFWFIGLVFLVGALPAALLLGRLQSRRSTALRVRARTALL